MKTAMEIVLIRHGETIWNEQGRYQGRTDIELSLKGTAQLQAVPETSAWKNYKLYSSPLLRARQTAHILFPTVEVTTDSRLIEIDFGSLEGALAQTVQARQDFSPPTYGWRGWFACAGQGPGDGESFHQVAQRLQSWLQETSQKEDQVVAVTHKGVILVAMALAYGWDMESKRPFKIQSGRCHRMTFSDSKGLRLQAINQEFGI